MDKKKILIVDDEQDFTNLIKLNLEATGKYEVETENRGMNAFYIAQEVEPDLILLDMIMPDLGGLDAAYQIKSDEKFKSLLNRWSFTI